MFASYCFVFTFNTNGLFREIRFCRVTRKTTYKNNNNNNNNSASNSSKGKLSPKFTQAFFPPIFLVSFLIVSTLLTGLQRDLNELLKRKSPIHQISSHCRKDAFCQHQNLLTQNDGARYCIIKHDSCHRHLNLR